MLNLSVRFPIRLAVNLIDFDPDIIDVVISFFSVAGKYAIYFGICYYLVKMVTRAFSGKERFL